MYRTCALTGSLLLLGFASISEADVINVDLPGTSSYDGWEGLTAANYPGYGAFPGTSDWPEPIASNTAGSEGAQLEKVANGAGGGPHPAGAGIYFGGFSGTPNSFGGTLGFVDQTPVAAVANVVLQLQISEAYGYDFHNDLPPTLAFNGGSQGVSASAQYLIEQEQTGTFIDPSTGKEEPVYLNTYLFQWDLSGIDETIAAFDLTFSGVQHAQLIAARLDQSDTYAPVTIPEPAGLAAFSLASLALLRRRRPAGSVTE